MDKEYKIDEHSECTSCGKKGLMIKEGKHWVLNYKCKCGGRIKTDFLKAMSK